MIATRKEIGPSLYSFFFFFALKFSMLQKLGIEPSTDHYYQVSLASGFLSNACPPTGDARPRPAVTSAVSYTLVSKNPNQPLPLLMQFIRFQVSDIRDALVTVYKVVPKVQCFLLEKVRYAVLCHPFCLYQDHPCSLLRACARRGVPRGSVVCVLGGEGRGCVQVYKCVCPCVCVCVL